LPNAALSEAIREAYASAPTDVVTFHTLEFRHPAFDRPLRVVGNHEDIVATLEDGAPQNAGEAVTFQAYAFRAELPKVSDEGVPEMTIQIDNVSMEIQRNIALAAVGGQKVEMTYRPFLSNDLAGGPQMDPPLTITVANIKADAFTVTARVAMTDLVNRQFPNEDFTAARFPGLVR
jgi:hypothetical protein